MLRPSVATRRRVLFMSDGYASPHGVLERVQGMKADGIVVSTVAVGEEADHAFLRQLAEAGGGRFHGVADPQHLPTVFRSETLRLLAPDDDGGPVPSE